MFYLQLITALGLINLFSESVGTMLFFSSMRIQSLGTSVVFCENIADLTSRQMRLCREYPDIMVNIGLGIQLAVNECQHQFRNNRWNCSSSYHVKDSTFYSNFAARGHREVAFINTITSAGVTYSVAKACSQGSIMNCACDPNRSHGSGRDANGEFDWTGCSDNIVFGMRFAKDFIDVNEVTRDPRSLMADHNSNAGRRSVRKHVKLKCKCHGVSGSCNIRTCWRAMQDFAYVGDFVKKKYGRAVMVGVNQDATGLVVISKRNRRRTVRKSDIVYMESSPDYCTYNPSTGSLGTDGRVCSSNSTAENNCERMCCSRGYNTRIVHETVNCECKFQWCCFVKCRLCHVTRNENTCKSPNSLHQIYAIGDNSDRHSKRQHMKSNRQPRTKSNRQPYR